MPDSQHAPADGITLPAMPTPDAIGVWGYMEPTTHSDAQLQAYARAAVELDRASPSRAAWIDVAARLPESGKAVLLDIGKKTPIRALWAAKATVEAGDDADDSWVEYDEASGTTYCPEGWYEWNEHEETHWAVSATPLRWMSIPVPAAVDVGAAQAETAQAAPTAALTDEQILAGYRAMLSCIEFFGPDAAIAAFRAATPGATHGN